MRRWLGVTLGLVLTLPLALSGQDSSADYTEPHERKAHELFEEVIRYRTALGHGEVPAMADYLADEFRAGGFPEEDIHLLPLRLPAGDQTTGLVVRYRGDDSSGEEPILLLAHMDVVDALPEDWVRDPFTLIEEDGYFFGRGTLDNKMGVVMLTTTFLRLKDEGFVPNRDLILAFTGDEETGMLTTRRMVREHADLTRAAYALNSDGGGGVLGENGEAISFAVQNSEKTYATFELTVTNPGGHSSTPRADNAIYELAGALKNIEAYRFPVQTTEATRLFFSESAKVEEGDLAAAMARFAENPGDTLASNVLWDHPDLVGITRTTCVATMLRAGHAENALPQSATATVNCRIFPGVPVAEIEATLLRVAATPGLGIEVLDDPTASPESPLWDEVFEAVTAAVEERYPGTPVIPYMAPYATDGKWIRAGGIPTYGISGLFLKPSDQFAHGLDERVGVKEFFGALEHWKSIITRLAGRPIS